MMKEHCPMTPCNFLMGSCSEAGIIVGDVRVVEAMYLQQNKYFDKHFIIQGLCHPLIGDSILFA